MYKKLSFLFLGLITCSLYLFVLYHVSFHYNEKRWIPKVVLELPNFNNKLNQTSHTTDTLEPDIFPIEDENESVQVLFDTTSLPAIEMIRPWSEEKNALQTYAKETFDERLPKISIILTEVGLDEKLFSKLVQKLPTGISLSFSPYAYNLSEKIRYARQNGFENMIDLPIQHDEAYINAGKYALHPDMDASEISKLLKENYFGLNVPFIGFYLNGKIPFSVTLWEWTKEQNITPYGLIALSSSEIDKKYDGDFFSSAIINELKEAEKRALQKGSYILAFPCHPVVIDVLIQWIGLQFHPKISFAPLSQLIQTSIRK